MEREPFEPVGSEAQWRMVYKAISALGVNDVITYEQLGEALGRDFLEDRAPIYRAMQELEREDKRTLTNVRNVGYRVAEPGEHEGLAKGHVRRSRRQLNKAKGRVDSADRNGLDAETRRRLDDMGVHLAQVGRAVTKLNRKVSEHDEALKDVREKAKADRRTVKADVAVLDDRVARLEAMLEKHGMQTQD